MVENLDSPRLESPNPISYQCFFQNIMETLPRLERLDTKALCTITDYDVLDHRVLLDEDIN